MTWDIENLFECTRFGKLWVVERITEKLWYLKDCGREGTKIVSTGHRKSFKPWAKFPISMEVGDFLFKDNETKTTSLIKAKRN